MPAVAAVAELEPVVLEYWNSPATGEEEVFHHRMKVPVVEAAAVDGQAVVVVACSAPVGTERV